MVTVEDVIVRPAKVPARSSSRERDAFLALSDALARAPENALHRLVEAALRLTGAQSSGVSLEDVDGAAQVFRWVATTGEFARYLSGTMPRDFSPCGTVVERGRTLVMRDPVRYYPYLGQLHAPIRMALLVPFARRGRFGGTLWVLTHNPEPQFTSEDVRVVQTLTTFATAILDTIRLPLPLVARS